MTKSVKILLLMLIFNPLFSVFAQASSPAGNRNSVNGLDLFFYVQLILTLFFGLAFPILIANRRWSKNLPKEYSSLTAILYMCPSIFGLWICLFVVDVFGLYNPAALIEANRFVDGPGTMTHLLGFMVGFWVLIPTFLISMRILYALMKRRWKNKKNLEIA